MGQQLLQLQQLQLQAPAAPWQAWALAGALLARAPQTLWQPLPASLRRSLMWWTGGCCALAVALLALAQRPFLEALPVLRPALLLALLLPLAAGGAAAPTSGPLATLAPPAAVAAAAVAAAAVAAVQAAVSLRAAAAEAQ